jgi:decaprenylphospho-beta-D-ribofuranose 2-oxidase
MLVPAPSTDAARAETIALVSFDQSVTRRVRVTRPDRYRMLLPSSTVPVIARGGGYSYVPASFGDGSTTIDMRRFDRVVRFEPAARLIEVEAGITLGALLRITAPHGLWLPVQPGYPAITIGGCLAANVNGKNPGRWGTFRHSVEDLTLAHPAHGVVRLDRATGGDIFELTLGGFGLTGVVTRATLRLEPLPGTRLAMRRIAFQSLAEGLSVIAAAPADAAFTYTWHDAATRLGAPFGRGIAYQGQFAAGPPVAADVTADFTPIGSSARLLPCSAWTSLSTRVANAGYWWRERSRGASELTLFDSLFPFARHPAIFLLFGRSGFIEYQAIVPRTAALTVIASLEQVLWRGGAPSVLLSMKAFKGEPSLLRFERDGICLTVYLRRTAAAAQALSRLDAVVEEAGGVINLMKDPRAPLELIRRLYPGYREFRETLHRFDPDRLFRSALSDRLAL